LSRAALSFEQRWRDAAGGTLRRAKDRDKRGMPADQALRLAVDACPRLDVVRRNCRRHVVGADHGGMTERDAHGRWYHLDEPSVLDEVVARAELHRLDRGFFRPCAREHDDRQQWAATADRAQPLEARPIRESVVEYDAVWLRFAQRPHALLEAPRAADVGVGQC